MVLYLSSLEYFRVLMTCILLVVSLVKHYETLLLIAITTLFQTTIYCVMSWYKDGKVTPGQCLSTKFSCLGERFQLQWQRFPHTLTRSLVLQLDQEF